MAIDPMTALSIGQGVVGFFEKKRAAEAQEARYQQNRMDAAAARDLQIQSLNQRAIQEAERGAGQKFDNALAALEVQERRKVAAGEAGIGGQGLDMLLQNTEARKLRNAQLINSQVKGTLTQLELQKQGVNAQMLQRINSLQRGVKPNAMAAALGIASNAYATELKYAGNKEGSFLYDAGFGGEYAGIHSAPLPIPTAMGDSN